MENGLKDATSFLMVFYCWFSVTVVETTPPTRDATVAAEGAGLIAKQDNRQRGTAFTCLLYLGWIIAHMQH